MSDEIGFMKEAARRGVAPVVLFLADTDRVSARSHAALRQQVPATALVTIDNEYVVRGELPEAFSHGPVLRIAALPVFLKTYIDRLNFSFTDYLRHEKDQSTELHQWIRRNYLSFRELELSLISARSSSRRRPRRRATAQWPSNVISVRTGTSIARSFAAPPRSGRSMMKQAATTSAPI